MSPFRAPLLLALSCLPVIGGCGASLYSQRKDAAIAAHKRGDLAAEALAWADACTLKPDDKKSCAEASRTADLLESKTLETARVACGRSGKLAACTASLVGLRRVRPNQSEAIALLRQSEAIHRESCQTLEQISKPSTMLARYNCVGEQIKTVNDPAYDAIVQEERESAAKRFVYAAQGATPAAAFVYARTAACFSKNVADANSVQSAEKTFVSATALPISLKIAVRGNVTATLEGTCSAIARNLGPRAYCAANAVADLTEELRESLGAVQHSVRSEMQIAEYVSGRETYTNPARASVDAAVRRAQYSFDAIEQDTRDREARCNSRRTKDACDLYEAIRPTYNERRRVLDDALSEQRRTPAVLERDIIARVPYTIRHHEWNVPYSVVVTSAAGATANKEGIFSRGDSEHPAVAPAGIRSDPLEVPTMADFNDDLAEAAIAAASSVYDAALRTRATCVGPFPLDDVAALECRARSELYATGALPKPAAWNVGCD